jgi:hypothetical protein
LAQAARRVARLRGVTSRQQALVEQEARRGRPYPAPKARDFDRASWTFSGALRSFFQRPLMQRSYFSIAARLTVP